MCVMQKPIQISSREEELKNKVAVAFFSRFDCVARRRDEKDGR